MSLFQESIIRKHLGYLDQELVDQAYLRFNEVYSAKKISNIKIAKEEQYQEGFIKDIFGAVLGYSVFPEQPFNIQTEKKNESDSKKADGAIFKGENVVGVIELKDNKTRNLDAVKDQAFGYKNNHKECSYVISSNFHKLRFYIDDATDYEEFDLYNLDKETFKRFYLYLQKEGLLDKNIPKLLRQETKFHEENITKSLYKDYSSFKNSFFQNVVKNNPQYDKLLLFKKSQKFLDKVLFVLFAEDKGLVATNSIVQIVEKWNDLKNDAFDTPKPLYELIALFFSNLFIGKKDQKGGVLIPEFGGEIFAPDEVLDALMVDDEVLQDDLLKLSKYDFNTDVDVNILGHIFEHSLSEIEEVEASLKGEAADKTKGKRKKDGVFYTPKYITKYIVENTVGKLCSEKKTELKIDVDIAIFEHQKADGKLNSKGIELYATLNQYKDWLLTLKILDPACGSGAFLNQAVNFLVLEHKFADDIIAELTNSPLRLFDTDIAILENNIYGVDINEESIEIAKLSLWLRTAQQGRKLSNLSNNIKCGNSLIDDPAVAGDKAFNWQNEFPEVFANGGFDVIIGNPPYGILIDKISQNHYIDNFPLTKYKTNLYVLFIERITQIFQTGVVHFIIPKSLLNNSYYEQIRKYLLIHTEINQIYTITEKVFQDAEVGGSLILKFTLKENANPNNLVKLISAEKIQNFISQNGVVTNEIPQNYFTTIENCEISIVSSDSQSILNKLNLLDSIKHHYSLKNGLNPGNIKQILISDKQETAKHKPIIWGKDIFKYNIVWSGQYINYDQTIGSRISISDVKSKEGMNKQDKIDYALRTSDLFENKKIVVRKTGDSLIGSIDINNYYFDTLVHGIYEKSKGFSIEFLVSVLNSKPATAFYRLLHDIKGKVFAKISLDNLSSFPLPNCTSADRFKLGQNGIIISEISKELFGLSEKFQRTIQRKFALTELPKKLQDWYLLSYAEFIKELEKKKIKLSLSEEAEWETYFSTEAKKALEIKSQIEKTDKEIDQMVYALYELTEDEIQIVEES